MSDQNLQNAQKALLEIEYENYGAIGDLFRGKGSWEIFYCEEASEDGYVAIEADDYIAEFNGNISGQAVCVQFMLSANEETYGLLYVDLDGEPLDGDEATKLLAKLAGGGSSGRRAGGERKSSSRSRSGGGSGKSSSRSGGSGSSGSRRASSGGRKSSARSGGGGGKSKAETAALEAWCEENGYEYSEEYWVEFEESEEYEAYCEAFDEEFGDDDEYDDDDYDGEDYDDDDDDDEDEDYDDDDDDDDEDYDDEDYDDDGDDYDDGGDDYDDGGDDYEEE